MGNEFVATDVTVAYEERLSCDSRWALTEASRYFEGEGAVQTALRKIAAKLEELGVDYAIAGGMALFHQGYRRFTEDVDVLVTRDGLKEIHRQLEGLGYLPPFPKSKNLRDTENGVKIEFIVTGDYPGDGKPKPVAFPNPAEVAIESDGIRFLTLHTLIELKLASGMTSIDRMKDLVDVQELIKTRNLPLAIRDRLNPYVQPKWTELWNTVRNTSKRYVKIWNCESLISNALDITRIIENLQNSSDELNQMAADNVEIDQDANTPANCILLVTTDPEVAAKYDMYDESEMWEDAQ